jgi:hypothetical protein
LESNTATGDQAIGPSDHRAICGTEKPSTDEPLSRSTDQPIPQDYGHFDATTWEIENGQEKVMIAQFQRFPSLTEAFKAHAQLLRGPRYRPAFAVRHEWKQFAERLGPTSSQLDMEHCGYSTNPSYSAELIKLVEMYRLNDPRALQWLATGQDPGIIGPSDYQAIGSFAKPGLDESAKRSASSI